MNEVFFLILRRVSARAMSASQDSPLIIKRCSNSWHLTFNFSKYLSLRRTASPVIQLTKPGAETRLRRKNKQGIEFLKLFLKPFNRCCQSV